jgi:AcrR family transcriptional regulator
MDTSTKIANDRRERRTRSVLEQALLALLEEKDYEAITVQKLCERADVARKTFYEYYDDKHGLLWAYSERVYHALQAKVTELDVQTLMASGKPLTYPLFVHVQEHASFYHAMLCEHSTAAFVIRLVDFMAEVSYERHAPLRAAATRITVPPGYIAHFLAGAALGVIRWWLKEDTKTPPESMAYQFSQLAVPGILDALGLS